MSNDELVRMIECSELSDNPLVKELVIRLEERFDSIDGYKDSDFTKHCVSWLHQIGGEDHHQDIIVEIEKLERMKKMSDRKEHINSIIANLNEMDRTAMDIIESVKHDGVIQ